jgi:outer membrane protein OmpA-like peptidoglycan-associated protein
MSVIYSTRSSWAAMLAVGTIVFGTPAPAQDQNQQEEGQRKGAQKQSDGKAGRHEDKQAPRERRHGSNAEEGKPETGRPSKSTDERGGERNSRYKAEESSPPQSEGRQQEEQRRRKGPGRADDDRAGGDEPKQKPDRLQDAAGRDAAQEQKLEDRPKADEPKRGKLDNERPRAEEEDMLRGDKLKRKGGYDEPPRAPPVRGDRQQENPKNAEDNQHNERTRAEQQQKNERDRRNSDASRRDDDQPQTKGDWRKDIGQDKRKPNGGEDGREREFGRANASDGDVRKDREHADQEFEKAKLEARRARERAGPADKKRYEESEKRFEALRQQRHERVEEGGRRVIIEEPDNRRIIRENGRAFIRHDESDRFRHLYGDVHEERRGDLRVDVFVRPGGERVFTEHDEDGHTLRRYRRGADGHEIVLFDNREYYSRAGRNTFADAAVFLPPPEIRIPRERYIVEYDRASDDDIYDALTAPPVERIRPRYSLEEVRYSRDLRDRMPRVDLDTIHFEFGSWEVDQAEYRLLERIARVMNRIIDRSPDEMFLIEGHTDAVGSDEDNLSLSDRRAQAVAEVLTREYRVPAENISTQGYGEQYLKINTLEPERANRRVAVRRITPLLARGEPRESQSR